MGSNKNARDKGSRSIMDNNKIVFAISLLIAVIWALLDGRL